MSSHNPAEAIATRRGDSASTADRVETAETHERAAEALTCWIDEQCGGAETPGTEESEAPEPARKDDTMMTHDQVIERLTVHPPHVVQEIALDLIDPSPFQPRRTFEAAALEELAQSIRAQGVLEAIRVRAGEPGRYELVYGERRTRAARLAGLTTIPAQIREMTDEQVLDAQLAENGQREAVPPLEDADAYAVARDRFKLSTEEI